MRGACSGLAAAVVLTCAPPVMLAQQPAWPSPSQARIRFTRSLDPAAMRGRPSLFARLAKVLIGGEDTPVMAHPHGLALGPDGRLYAVDTASAVVHVYGLAKKDYRRIDVGGESPIGIAFAGDRMIVTDSVAARVRGFDLKGHEVWSLGPGDGFVRPTGVTASGERAFVVDTARGRVISITAQGRILSTFGQRGAGPGELNFPTHIAARGRHLYVTDTLNFRVQVFDDAGRFLRAFGQLGDGPGDFDKPKGIAVDSTGRIYVVEGLRDVVQIFDEDGRLLLVFGGSGDGPGQLWLPAGIAVSGDQVFVADAANHRVQVYERMGDSR